MNPDQIYEYAQGDLLEKPHNYQYSAYKGMAFIHAWQESRDQVLPSLGSPAPPPEPFLEQENRFSVHYFLENLMDEMLQGQSVKSNLDIWTKKFEVSKRLFAEYNEQYKPVDKSKFHDMAAYVRYAEVMEKAYRGTAKLPYLNVFLKAMDTLIACKDRLDAQQKARLAWLVERERNYVLALTQKRRVEI